MLQQASWLHCEEATTDIKFHAKNKYVWMLPDIGMLGFPSQVQLLFTVLHCYSLLAHYYIKCVKLQPSIHLLPLVLPLLWFLLTLVIYCMPFSWKGNSTRPWSVPWLSLCSDPHYGKIEKRYTLLDKDYRHIKTCCGLKQKKRKGSEVDLIYSWVKIIGPLGSSALLVQFFNLTFISSNCLLVST